MNKYSRAQINPVNALFSQARGCSLCAPHLPLPPRPIIQGSASASILIIGQAPGIRAHNSAMAWNDPSGDRLRLWLGMDRQQFYDEKLVAILPMGFCYPGKGSSGDLPPRKECASLWHLPLINGMSIKLKLFIGQYAQDYYLKDGLNLTARVKRWREYLPDCFVLPHPSPRNNIWLKRNPWFEQDVVPHLQQQMQKYLKT